MYCLYKIIEQNGKKEYQFLEQISLAGCNSGIIPKHLRERIGEWDNPPAGWVIPISEIYAQRDQAVVIDIKPESNNETVLCELDKVFGYSHPGWSPIMLRLKELFNENTIDLEIDKSSFLYPDTHQILYTMSYLNGSFIDGELTGKWIFPKGSPTNGLLMWPDAISFFYDQIKKLDWNSYSFYSWRFIDFQSSELER